MRGCNPIDYLDCDEYGFQGADGKWYDESGIGYLPSAIPNNKAATYTLDAEIVKECTITFDLNTDLSFDCLIPIRKLLVHQYILLRFFRFQYQHPTFSAD